MTLIKSDFDSSAINQAEALYSKAQLAPDQRGVIESLAKIMAKFVPISEIAIRGFAMMAAVEWQKKYSKPVSSVAQAGPQERVKFMVEVLNIIGAKFKQILHLKGKEKEAAVDEGIKQTLEFYRQSFLKR